MKKYLVSAATLVITLMIIQNIFAEKQSQNNNSNQTNSSRNDKPLYAVVGGQEQGLTPFPNNESTRRIIKRTDSIREGDRLASSGLYDEAIIKFKESMAPSLLNDPNDEGGGRYGVMKVHIRQKKFEEALKEYQWFIDSYEKGPFAKDKSGRYLNTVIDRKLELEALIQARDTGTTKPVYDHIAYLKNKYKKDLTGDGFASGGYATGIIADITHLYDYLGDAESGIAFMNETLGYLKKHRLSPSFRFAIAEYELVKQAFEEDKRTGTKGHLQKVIETSSYIGW